MQITVSDKVIARAINYVVDGSVYSYFDTATIKAAGLPKKADLIKAAMADEKFMNKLAKRIAREAEDLDQLSEYIYDIDCKTIVDAVNGCEAVYEVVHEATRKKQRAAEIECMVQILKEQGYTVTK